MSMPQPIAYGPYCSVEGCRKPANCSFLVGGVVMQPFCAEHAPYRINIGPPDPTPPTDAELAAIRERAREAAIPYTLVYVSDYDMRIRLAADVSTLLALLESARRDVRAEVAREIEAHADEWAKAVAAWKDIGSPKDVERTTWCEGVARDCARIARGLVTHQGLSTRGNAGRARGLAGRIAEGAGGEDKGGEKACS